ncbi:hypothetical protein R6Q59_011775 [Mikania micrantha]
METNLTPIPVERLLQRIIPLRGFSVPVVSTSRVLLKSGSILFRSFTVVSPSNFNNVIEAFGLPKLFYVGGRERPSPTQLTGADEEIPLHHEMAYIYVDHHKSMVMQ